MGNLDTVDLDWTWEDDYVVGYDGDIGDTSDDHLRSLENEIATISKASLLDWEKDPTLGCQLSDYVGEANTRETGKSIENRVKYQLIAAGIVRPEEISVRVTPIGIYRVMIMIQVLTLATANNRLVPGDSLTVTLAFDTIEHSVMVLPNLLPRVATGDIY